MVLLDGPGHVLLDSNGKALDGTSPVPNGTGEVLEGTGATSRGYWRAPQSVQQYSHHRPDKASQSASFTACLPCTLP